MKKLLMVAGIVVFTAASCNNTAAIQPPPNVPPVTQPPTPTPAPTSADSKSVQIISLSPSFGAVGTPVIIRGQGFTAKDNQILLGDSLSSSHHMDKTPANMIVSADSADGITLSFTFPTVGMSGIICDAQNRCVGISASKLQPGPQKISVSNKTGLSNAMTFTLTK